MGKNIERLVRLALNGVVTHKSRFHADDILSAALLKIAGVISDISVIHRVGHVPDGFKGLAFDIGGGEFDHHEGSEKFRENGNQYAAFGLLWSVIGAEYIMCKYRTNKKIATEAAAKFDSEFIALMDLTDNYGPRKYPNTLSYLIAHHNRVKYTDQERDTVFVNLANNFCEYLDFAIEDCYKFVRDKAKAKKLAVSEVITLPFKSEIDRSAFEGTKVQYIVKKSHRGTFNITVVEPYRIPLYCKDMPGCVQVYKIGAAFKKRKQALAAVWSFVTKMHTK